MLSDNAVVIFAETKILPCQTIGLSKQFGSTLSIIVFSYFEA